MQPTEYADKIIDYKHSPTGKAYVGINKLPLMPVKKGYGFMGVLLQDEKREFIMCHSCGKWMRKIASKHLLNCCGLTSKQYKKKFGLNQQQGLVSDATSLALTKACLMNRNACDISKYVGVHGRKTKQSIAFFNQYGTCPLQLKTRLYEFIRCNRELPAQSNRGRRIYKALINRGMRYKSWSDALVDHGLPKFKRRGTNMEYTFKDGTKYKYNINKFYDREELFSLLMKKCPVLTESL